MKTADVWMAIVMLGAGVIMGMLLVAISAHSGYDYNSIQATHCVGNKVRYLIQHEDQTREWIATDVPCRGTK